VLERANVLMNAANLLANERNELAAVEVMETGKPWADALADVDEAIDYLRYYSKLALQLEPYLRDYQPHGVVAVIPPWNFPAAIPCGMTTGALITGNAVILKSAEQSALVAEHLVRLLHRAGVPQEVLIHLSGEGETIGKALVESPDVGMVAFTGSRDVGRWIYEASAKVSLPNRGMKNVVAEMGGKNAMLVFADADLDEAVQGIVRSAFGYAGQKCSACSRVLIERPVFDRLKARLVDAIASLSLGPAEHPGTVLPPVINEEAYERLLKAAEVAREEGIVLLDRLGQSGPGYQLGPLVVELRSEQAFTARTAQEELFGPILAIMPFDSEAEAVRMASATSYALTAGIFSRSPRTIDRVVKALQAGDVYVNRETTGARVAIEPFGGHKLSGTGPQAGGSEYLWPFLTNRSRRSTGSARRGESDFGESTVTPSPPALALWPWAQHGARQRAVIVQSALAELGRQLDDEGLGVIERSALRLAERLVANVGEIADPEHTRPLPGQRTYVLWETPRGVGFATGDDSSRLEDWLALVLAPLLAGNGLLLAPAASHREATLRLAEALFEAGVPRDVLEVSPYGPEAAVELAKLPINFAVLDVAEPLERRIAQELGKTPDGQRWLKARISLADGPGPEEPGFLRRFALPKTVSIRTLHHGAALEE
jgi:acyl-CoA reductase-like NAD-dependent aldehyde dehydrogenase